MPDCLVCRNHISERSQYSFCLRCGTPIGSNVPPAPPARRSGALGRALSVIGLGLVCLFGAFMGLMTAVATGGLRGCQGPGCELLALGGIAVAVLSVGGFFVAAERILRD